jgi:hypothetical protein
MAADRAGPALASIEELDGLRTHCEDLADRLVRLEPVELPELRTLIRRLRSSLIDGHLPVWEARLSGVGSGRSAVGLVLSKEHAIFPGSLDRYGWLFDIVEAEDHGGHRQALGQYGKLVAEALRLHLSDERELLEEDAPGRAKLRRHGRSPALVRHGD